MKKIFIVGGGGFARECHMSLMGCIKHGTDQLEFGGFLGHNGNVMDCKKLQSFFLGDVSQHKFADDQYCVIGVGRPELRKLIFDDLKKLGAKLYNLLSVECKLSPFVEMGEGNIITSSTISTDVSIGDGNLFNGQVIVGHDCRIGSFNFFGPRANVLGQVSMGDLNSIGTGSVLLPGCKVGNLNKIAPLSAVYKGCKDRAYMLGNPAVKIGNVE